MKSRLLYFAIFLSSYDAYKILVIFPYPARSHANLGDGVVRNLLREGHEVTYISPFPYEPASPSLRVIDVSANAEIFSEKMYNFTALFYKEYKIDEHYRLISVLVKLMKHTVLNDNVQQIMRNPLEEFDAVIIEWFLAEVLAGYAVMFNCPLIWVSALDTHWYILRLIEHASNSAYSADFMSSAIPPFTFWQRVTELYIQIKILYLKYTYFNALEKQEYEALFDSLVKMRGRHLPSYFDIQYNASLILSTTHVSIGIPLSVPHNFISIGGYHIEEDLPPLPPNLKKVMDNSTNGVIYYSMGSNLKSKDIPIEILNSILKMFGELNQTVIWKFEESLSEIPQNVHILKWAPQHGILAHPNTVLFITHGGLLSTTEAIHFGVPIIGIPIFADQFANVGKSVKKGFGKQVDFSHNIAKELKTAIKEMINNATYTEKAKELSFIYHDRPVKPGKELVHWVRHVIQTRGAPHLRSPALEVSFYQKLYLDLLAIVLVILLIILKLTKIIINYLRQFKCLLIKYMYNSKKYV